MNTMTMERIEHEEAKKVAEKINIDWTKLVDFTNSLNEVKQQINSDRMDEEEAREAFAEYFSNLADDLEWYAVQIGEDDDAGTGSWDYDDACDMARQIIEGLKQTGKADVVPDVIVSTWTNNLHDPYCTDTYRIGEEEYAE